VATFAYGPTPNLGVFDNCKLRIGAERTLQRAAERLGGIREKSGFSGGWTWAMSLDKVA
jgi:hypothetical protein